MIADIPQRKNVLYVSFPNQSFYDAFPKNLARYSVSYMWIYPKETVILVPMAENVHYKLRHTQLFATLVITPSTRQELHPLLAIP